jgi:hypothetical protein
MIDTMDPIGGRLKDEGYCIFILVIASMTLELTVQKPEWLVDRDVQTNLPARL